MISREKFIEAIEALRVQTHKDVLACDAIEKLFVGSQVNVYDNSLVIKAVIRLLREWFPVDENGFCEISHYCWELNFGKHGDNEVITAGDLYDRLLIDKLREHPFTTSDCFKVATKGSYASLDSEKITHSLSDEVGQYVKPELVGEKLEKFSKLVSDDPSKFKDKAAKYLADEVGHFNFRKPASENADHTDWKLTIKQSPVKGQFILEEEGIVPLEEIAKGLPNFIKTKEIINEAINRLNPQG